MIELGVKQKLYIDHKTDFGVYLSDTPERNGKSDCVLLPKKQVPQNAKIGDEVEVFVYRDSKDREIATTNMPKLQLGELAVWAVELDLLNKILEVLCTGDWRKIFFFHIVNRL